MTVYFGVESTRNTKPTEEEKREEIELNPEDLEEIRDEGEHFTDIIENELEKRKGVGGLENADLCYCLSAICNDIKNANSKINRIIERRK